MCVLKHSTSSFSVHVCALVCVCMCVYVCIKDWRAHYQQMHSHSNGIASAMDNTRSHLDKLHKEITKALEKIESREKYTNSQVSVTKSLCLVTHTLYTLHAGIIQAYVHYRVTICEIPFSVE